MANHTTQQRMHEDLKRFLKKMYPEKTMANATKELSKDLWEDVVYGKRIAKKYKEKSNEKK